MKREDCWMSFSEALELYLQARQSAAPIDSSAGKEALRDVELAMMHMNALTDTSPRA
jgi:hypothetical protein